MTGIQLNEHERLADDPSKVADGVDGTGDDFDKEVREWDDNTWRHSLSEGIQNRLDELEHVLSREDHVLHLLPVLAEDVLADATGLTPLKVSLDTSGKGLTALRSIRVIGVQERELVLCLKYVVSDIVQILSLQGMAPDNSRLIRSRITMESPRPDTPWWSVWGEALILWKEDDT